jgi:hypothetical protein
MDTLYMVMYLVALVLFVLDAFGVVVRRLNLLALGLAFWVAVPFLQAALKL